MKAFSDGAQHTIRSPIILIPVLARDIGFERRPHHMKESLKCFINPNHIQQKKTLCNVLCQNLISSIEIWNLKLYSASSLLKLTLNVYQILVNCFLIVLCLESKDFS